MQFTFLFLNQIETLVFRQSY